jgi:DNA-binding NtrC family response regulator
LSEQPINISFITRDSGLAQVIARALGAGFSCQAIGDAKLSRLGELRDFCDVVIIDLRDSGVLRNRENGLQLVEAITQFQSHPPVVVLCDSEDHQVSMSVMERGAYDTVSNPLNIADLRLILKRAAKLYSSEKEVDRLRTTASAGVGRLHELLGTSPAMQEMFALVQKIAPCDVNVLITGETGTGKELLARAIHQLSSRATKSLIAFSCVNLPETLIEDELFGHEKGAFTGAMMARRGRLETADQGTLFLDEIGDLGLGLQPKLLRVLQERSFERLGSNTPVNLNIRLVCATNRNLSEMVQKGTFREDLYYRLNVVHMHLPPLRDRREDIPLLAQHFLEISAGQFGKKAKRFSQGAVRTLEEYGWPGNVRELENAVQRAVVLSDGPIVDAWHLPPSIVSAPETTSVNGLYEEEVRQFKKRLIVRTLRECNWHKAESARVLGVARGYLHRLINQLEIREPEDAEPEVRDRAPAMKQSA